MNKRYKFRVGLSLVELVITIVISSIIALSVGVLLIGGQRSWQQTYEDANSKMRQDSYAIMSAFGSVGRKSNRLGYTLYSQTGSAFHEAEPEHGGGTEIVYGDAVEFRYWSSSVPTSDLLDVTNTGTDYAFFYVDSGKLKVDYGTNPPGAITGGANGTRNTSDITTMTLAENVVPDPNGLFNHTVVGGIGQGCVRINLTLESDDEDSNKQIRVLTATLARNMWPR